MTEQAPFTTRPGKASRNEQRKALAATFNFASVAVLISTVLQPLTSGTLDLSRVVLATGIFVVLQIVLHYVLARVED